MKNDSFRGQTNPPYPYKNTFQISDRYERYLKDDKNILQKIFLSSGIEKFNLDFLDIYPFQEKYEKGELLSKSLDYIISLQKKVFDISNKKIYVDTLFSDKYINDIKSFGELGLDNVHKGESDIFMQELQEKKDQIMALYLVKKDYKTITDIIKEILKVSYENSLNITDRELIIKHKLEIKSEDLHKEIWRANGITKIHELEGSWQMKHLKYEKELRDEKPEINILIIEDQEKIRNKMKEILSMQFDNYRLNFSEIDSFEEAKNFIQMSTLENCHIILDNNFYDKSHYIDSRTVKPDMGVKLFNFISRYKKSLLDNIIICSSNEDISEKFPANTDIVKGKSFYDFGFVSTIAEKIKEKIAK